MIYRITCFFLRLIFRLFSDYKVYGMEKFPRKGSFIIASNHVSYADPCAIGAFIRRKTNYVAKQELYRSKWFGWYLRKVRTIPVDKDNPARGMREVIKMIKKGYPIVIFPEGTRSDGINMLEPESGVGYLAIKHNLPVVPAYVQGTAKFMPKGARCITPCAVRVYYGNPKVYHMEPGRNKDEVYNEVSRKIMDEIKALKAKYDA